MERACKLMKCDETIHVGCLRGLLIAAVSKLTWDFLPQDKKCGWLFVQAYHQLCSPEQKAYLDEHYGKCKVQTPEEQKIKDIYKEVGLERKYTDYETKSFQDILAFKNQVQEANVPWEIIEIFLKKVYKRTK